MSSANTSAPVVSSASYTFVAGDVGALWFGKLGTNLLPGFYPIASVSGGNATLNAAIGAAVLYGGATVLNTVAGVSASSSLSSITWGIDYSQQASPQFTFTDLVIDGTTNTKFTSAAFPVGKNFVGNLINITSGTGFTVQRVEVVSTTGTAGTADKSLGTLSSTGGNGKLGGALDGMVTLAAAMATNNRAFVASGTYTQTATATFSTAQAVASSSATLNRITGYYQSRGDIAPTTGGTYTNNANRPVVKLGTNAGLTAIVLSNNGWLLEHLIVDCSSLTTSNGITMSGSEECRNVLVKNFTASGIAMNTSGCGVFDCEITGASGSTGISMNAGPQTVIGCNIHDNTFSAAAISINAASFGTFTDNLITNNATGHGIAAGTNAQSIIIRNNTIYASGGDGIRITARQWGAYDIRGNLLASNGGYGLNENDGAGTAASIRWDGNAYWNNTSGTRHNFDDVGSGNAINGVAPYVNVLDVTLSADPFVAKASNDYRLNTTAGGGAAARGHGVPTAWPGNSLTVATPDMGAVQHVDSGTGGGPVGNNFRGGFCNG